MKPSKQTAGILSSVLELLDSGLRPLGFSASVARTIFERRREGGGEYFQLVVLKDPKAYRINPAYAVGFTVVSEWLRKCGVLGGDEAGPRMTVGLMPWNQQLPTGYQIRIDESTNPQEVVTRLMGTFQSEAVPYFQQMSSLEALDRALNADPDSLCVHAPLPILRCSIGVIVATLVRRANIQDVVMTYRRKLAALNDGFYLPKFLALCEGLGLAAIASNRSL